MTIPEDFKTRLKIAKSKIKKQVQSDNEKRGSFMGSAFKLGSELVAAVAVGTIFGFILDSWFGTKPWLIIIFFFFGCGCRHVKRNSNCQPNAKRRLIRRNLWQTIQCSNLVFIRLDQRLKLLE